MTATLFPREKREVAPGAVHVPDWLTMDDQRRLVAEARVWARPPAPMHNVRLPYGGVTSVRMVCLGWHWVPYRYSRIAEDVDGAPVKSMPPWLAELGGRAVGVAYDAPGSGAGYVPDVALVNHYDSAARLGLHQDKDERSREPVVSLSVGDTCLFRFGNPDSRGRPYTDVELRSGDLFVFGGASRLAYHGVPKTYPGTGDPSTGLSGGRLNITLRVTGL